MRLPLGIITPSETSTQEPVHRVQLHLQKVLENAHGHSEQSRACPGTGEGGRYEGHRSSGEPCVSTVLRVLMAF